MGASRSSIVHLVGPSRQRENRQEDYTAFLQIGPSSRWRVTSRGALMSSPLRCPPRVAVREALRDDREHRPAPAPLQAGSNRTSIHPGGNRPHLLRSPFVAGAYVLPSRKRVASAAPRPARALQRQGIPEGVSLVSRMVFVNVTVAVAFIRVVAPRCADGKRPSLMAGTRRLKASKSDTPEELRQVGG